MALCSMLAEEGEAWLPSLLLPIMLVGWLLLPSNIIFLIFQACVCTPGPFLIPK